MKLSPLLGRRLDVRPLLAATSVGAHFLLQASAQSDAPARIVFQGSFYRYGFLGPGAPTNVFGPAQDSFATSYEFDMGGATNRSVISELDLVSSGGVMSLYMFNESRLGARRLDGNDHGGGLTTHIQPQCGLHSGSTS